MADTYEQIEGELCPECIFPIHLDASAKRWNLEQFKKENIRGVWWSVKLGHWACAKTHLDMCNRDDVNILNFFWEPIVLSCVSMSSPFFYGREVRWEEDIARCVSVLAEAGADVNKASAWFDATSPLLMTLKTGRVLLFKQLLKLKADVNVLAHGKRNLLYYAVREDKEQFCWMLWAAGCSTTHKGGLFRCNITERCKKWIEGGVKVNCAVKEIMRLSACNEPQSLMDLSRNAVRSRLIAEHPNLLHPVSKLGLPSVIHNYILLDVNFN